MRVTIIGAGYVGLVSGACLADAGHRVSIVDTSYKRIAKLRCGEMPIYEPGLAEIVSRNVVSGHLGFTQYLAARASDADVIMIAVGTPEGPDGAADLSQVMAAARAVAGAINQSSDTVVVIKSTVPVGTGDLVEGLMREIRPDADFEVVSNPEFLREGSAIADFMRPDRVVVGTSSASARGVLRRLYAPITDRLVTVDRRTSELVKYAANAFLAMKVTFINEIADLCEAVGADIDGVAEGIGTDPRIGRAFLKAGPGYGGSCFPKDTMALVLAAKAAASPLCLIDATIAVNEARKAAMVDRVIKACGGSVDGLIVTILGLTFKAGTDDVRDSPAVAIARGLSDAGAIVVASDPQGMENARALLPGVEMVAVAMHACMAADAVVIATEWPEYATLDLPAVATTMWGNVIVDLRDVIDPAAARAAGLSLIGIGRLPRSLPQETAGGLPARTTRP